MDDAHRQRLADGEACLQAALEYLKLGWSPLSLCPPDHVGVGRVVKDHGRNCESPGKRPWHTWKEFQKRPPTEAEVRDWWRQLPNSNVGVALGPVSGLIRVDVEGGNGERRLAEMSGGDLPPTLEFISGREGGGRGLLYAIPSGADLRTTFEKPAPGEEVRLQAQGAQTALPPSRHPSGAAYAWKPGHSPGDIKPATAPAWLLAALARPVGSRAAAGDGSSLDELFSGVEEGGRNDGMASVIGKLVGNLKSIDGSDARAAWWAAQAINERNSPPLPEAELRTIFRSILGREAEKRDKAKQQSAPALETNGRHAPGDVARPESTHQPPEPGWAITFGGEIVRQGKPDELDVLGVPRKKSAFQVFEVMDLQQLLTTVYPEPKWAVQGLLAEGLNLLAGNPKSGKSMLALNLCLTVAGGGAALGGMPTVPGDVLYLSLEDQFRRVQFRARKMSGLLTPEAHRRLCVVTKWPRIHKGGLTLLDEWLGRAESPRLLVVDVLGKFRPPTRDRGNAYEQDSEAMYEIKEFADDHGITVLVLHHTRKKRGGKSEDEDEFETVSGTQGITGACDGVIVMVRQRQTENATIAVTGRDDEEKKLSLRFDPKSLVWTSLGSTAQLIQGKFQLKILRYMQERPDALLYASRIAEAVDADPGAVRKTLHRLETKGLICQVGNGWRFPAGGTIPPGLDDEALETVPPSDPGMPEVPEEFAQGDSFEGDVA